MEIIGIILCILIAVGSLGYAFVRAVLSTVISQAGAEPPSAIVTVVWAGIGLFFAAAPWIF